MTSRIEGKAKPHPKYNGDNYDNDIAIVKLDKEINFKDFSGTVTPACLARYSIAKNHVQRFYVGKNPGRGLIPMKTLRWWWPVGEQLQREVFRCHCSPWQSLTEEGQELENFPRQLC